MQIPMDKILEFHKRRTQCHVASLNYFAGLLGYNFPKHDYDKFINPIQIGYAYYNYANYHPNCKITQQYKEAFLHAHDEHHCTQPHHIEHYTNIQEMNHNTIIEMVCDWFSANFEQTNITHINKFKSVMDFFEKQLSQLNWTKSQRETIIETINFLQKNTDSQKLYMIWADII